MELFITLLVILLVAAVCYVVIEHMPIDRTYRRILLLLIGAILLIVLVSRFLVPAAHVAG